MKRLLSFKLSKTEMLILGALLTVAEGVQVNVTMSQSAHAVLTIAIMVISGTAPAISASSFIAQIPPALASLLSSVIGALLVLTQSFSISKPLQTVIAVIVVAAVSLGISAATPAAPVAAKT